jgi:AhpD family alkylhydroperoxidase
MYQLERPLRESGLDPKPLELIKTRASQVNGCAYCIDMHTKDTRAHGETEQHLFALSAWREAVFYTGKERAAFKWTEAITDIQRGHAADDVFEEVRKHFADAALMSLTLTITTINAWNRIGIAFRWLRGPINQAARTRLEPATSEPTTVLERPSRLAAWRRIGDSSPGPRCSPA